MKEPCDTAAPNLSAGGYMGSRHVLYSTYNDCTLGQYVTSIEQNSTSLTRSSITHNRVRSSEYLKLDNASRESNSKISRCVLETSSCKRSSQRKSFIHNGNTMRGTVNLLPLRVRAPLATWCVGLCVCVMFLIPVGLCFNVDIRTNVLHQSQLGSMFGFTVDQYREDGTNWLLIGAPEADNPEQSTVDRPGVVYKCPTTRGQCHLISFDKSGSDRRFNYTNYIQSSNKSQQWFGATLSSSSEHGYVLSCAPRYIYFTSTGLKREPIGVCFLYEYASGRPKITTYYPCKTETQVKDGDNGAGKSSCQAALSSGLFNADKFIIGAVGSFYWQGQIMIQDIHNKTNVVETRDSGGREDASYHGYALAIGNFNGDNNPDIAASAPRLHSKGGEVKLYDHALTKLKSLKGSEQIGEYFGYSLAVSDFNADGLDDIVVGAPFYAGGSTSMYEIGHVYVFIQTEQHDFVRTELMGDKEPKARFGTAVSSLGDLDDDGYNDLIVGAPYGGVDYKGAIYIYQGDSSGILHQYSQKIDARDVSDTLMTFGFSVKGGMDQDDNEYPDIVVGAYDSAEVVFFRTRPVIRVHVDVITTPRTINLEKHGCRLQNGTEVTCFSLHTCLSYDGKGVPRNIDLEVTWQLDANYKQYGRVYYLDGTENDRRKKSIIALYLGNKPVCSETKVVLKKSIRDKLSSIITKVSYIMVLGRPEPDQLQPVLDKYASTTVNASVDIEKNCGDDDVCIPDLKLDLSSKTPNYAFGNKDELDVTVMVENLGEESYETQLYLDLPPGVTYINIHNVKSKTTVSCTMPDPEQQTLVCNIGNPLPADKTVNFGVRIQPQNITNSIEALIFTAVVNSSNPENDTDTSNNVQSMRIIPTAVIDIITTGVSMPEQVLYNSSIVEVIATKEDVGPKFVHRYVVTNNGPSALASLTTEIYWPELLTDGSLIFYLTQLPQVKQGQGHCSVDLIDLHNITDMVYKPKEGSGILQTALMYMFSDKSEDDDDTGEKNFKVTCGAGQENYCKKIECVTGALGESESVIIEVHSRVFINSMVTVLEAFRGVIVTSLARATVASLPYEHAVLNKPITNDNTVDTFVTAIGIGAGTGEVPWWVIALAIVGGAIMLMLLVFGLWKCGFFKRLSKPEDKEHLEDNEETKTTPPMEMKNGKNGNTKPPPKIQVDPESKNLYKELPDEDF